MSDTPIKTILITGATSGIGKASAKLFAKKGYRLIITGRRKDRLDEMSKEYAQNYSTDILSLCFDVRHLDEVKSALDSIPPEFASIDILLNNAGLASGLDAIHTGDFEDWDRMIDTNLKGLLYMTRLISPGMVERQSGHIINVCSIAGHEVYPKGNVYNATKFGVEALTRSMRLDLYEHNIRVSMVSPAHVEETEFSLVRFHGDNEKSKIYEDFNPLKAKDVAETIYFIATRPKHVNIQDIILWGTQQANATMVDRTGRRFD